MATQSYNKSEIFKDAWTRFYEEKPWLSLEKIRNLPAEKKRKRFANCLSYAWSDAKRRRAEAAMTADQIRKQLREDIMVLDNKTRWNQHDYAAMDVLHAQLRQLSEAQHAVTA